MTRNANMSNLNPPNPKNQNKKQQKDKVSDRLNKKEDNLKRVTSLARQFVSEASKLVGKKDANTMNKLFDMSRAVEDLNKQTRKQGIRARRDAKQKGRADRLLDNQAFGLGSVDKLTDQLTRLNDILTSSDTKEQITNSISSLIEPIHETLADGKKLLSTTSTFMKVGTGVALLAFLVTFCKLISYLVKTYKEIGPWKSLAGAIITGICGALYLAGFPEWMKEKILVIEQWFSADQENQGAFDTTTHSALSLLFGGLMIFHGKTPENASWFEKFLSYGKTAVFAERMSASIQSILGGTKGFIEDAINFIRLKILGLGPMKVSLQANQAVTDWVEEVDTVLRMRFEGNFPVDSTNGTRVAILRHQYFKFTTTIPQHQWKDLAFRLRAHWSALSDLYKEFDKINLANDGPRMEPVMLTFNGVPGVGKSSATYLFAVECLEFVLTEDEKKAWPKDKYGKFIFTWDETNKRLDGLANQKIWIIDDIFQHKVVAGGEPGQSAALLLIKICNRFPYKTEQADLANKGVIFARPEVIICTTNHTNLEPALTDIHFPEAVARRMTRYTVLPDRDFVQNPENGISRNLGPAEQLKQAEQRILKKDLPYSTKIYNFHPTSFDGKYSVSDYCGWNDLIQKVKEEHAHRKLKHEEYNQVLVETTERSLRSANSEVDDDYKTCLSNQVGLAEMEDLNRATSFDENQLTDQGTYDSWNQTSPDDDDLFNEIENMTDSISIESIVFNWTADAKVWVTDEEKHKLVKAIVEHIKEAVPDYIDKPTFIRKIAGVIRSGLRSISTRTKDLTKAIVYCKIFSSDTYRKKYLELCEAKNQYLHEFMDRRKATYDWLERWRNYITNKVKELYNSMPSWKIIGTILTGLSMLGLLFYGVRTYFKGKVNLPQMYNRDGKAKQHKPRRKLLQKQVNQAFTDNGAQAIWNKVLDKNSYTIFVKFSDEELEFLGCGLFIKENYFMFPHHFVLMVKEHAKLKGAPQCIHIEGVRNEEVIEFGYDVFTNIRRPGSMMKKDLCYIEVPIKNFKADITGAFVRESDIKDKQQVNVVISTIDPANDNSGFPVVMPIKSQGTLYNTAKVPQPGSANELTIEGVVEYKVPTVSGDCGSVVFIENNKSLGKILGIHVAGRQSGTHGTGDIITASMIDEWFPVNENQGALMGLVRLLVTGSPDPLIWLGAITPQLALKVSEVDQKYPKFKEWIESITKREEFYKYCFMAGLLDLQLAIDKSAVMNDLMEKYGIEWNVDNRDWVLSLLEYARESNFRYSEMQIRQWRKYRFGKAAKWLAAEPRIKLGQLPSIPDGFFGRHDYASYLHRNFPYMMEYMDVTLATSHFTNIDASIVDNRLTFIHDTTTEAEKERIHTRVAFYDGVVEARRKLEEPTTCLDEPLVTQGSGFSHEEIAKPDFLPGINEEDILSITKLPYKGYMVIPKGNDEWNKLHSFITSALPVWPYGEPVKVFAQSWKRISSPRTHDIRPSELQGEWGPTFRKPAHLRTIKVDGVEVDPVTRIVKKYKEPDVQVDDSVLVTVARSIFRHKASGRPPIHQPRVYSFEEAVRGVENLKAIPKGTSPGFPLSEMRGNTRGKTKWLGQEDIDFDSPEMVGLRERVMLKARMLGSKKYINVGHFVVDTKKAELRPIEKADAGKTRIFGACSLDDLILCRMFEGSYQSWNRDYKIDNGLCMGMNPYSDDWNRLYNHLSKKGWQGIDGDFSEYDAHQSAKMHELLLEHVVEPYYRMAKDLSNYEFEKMVRFNLRFMMTHSIHLANPDYTSMEICDMLTDTDRCITPFREQIDEALRENRQEGAVLYQVNSCMPSGHFNTTQGNGDIQDMYKRTSFAILSGQPVWHAMELYEDNVEDKRFGDDGVTSVSPYAAEFFNQLSIPVAMKKLGVIFTPANKDTSGNGPLTRPITELSFLKRGFRYEERLGRVVAPLELRVVLDTPYWTKKGDDDHQIVKTNVDNALEELALHPKEVFDEWAPKIIKASWDKLSYVPVETDYETLLMKVTHRDDWF